jgi:phage virion morphogenesis protein
MMQIQYNDAQIRALLQRLQQTPGSLQPAMRDIGQNLTQNIGFREQRDPWGAAWKALSRATLNARRKGKGGGSAKILQDTGRLRNAINSQPTANAVAVGVANVKYALVHQFGASIAMGARTQTLYFKQKKNGQVGNRFVKKSRSNFAQEVSRNASTLTIPARPYLPIRGGKADLPNDWQAEIVRLLDRHLQKIMQGAT